MRTFLKWLAAILAAVVLMAGFFALYSRFLVDYSLQSLESAERLAERADSGASATTLQVYQQLMQNVLLDEAAREDADLRNLAYLQMASRTAAEQSDGDFRSRYKFYLSEVQKNKQQDRSFVLKVIDRFYQFFLRIQNIVTSFGRYLQGKFTAKKVTALDLTSAVLLSQAEVSEKSGDLERAATLYERYLERNSENADAGYITLTLAEIRIKQKKWDEAQRLLEKNRAEYAGQEEGKIADTLLRRVSTMKMKWQELDKTLEELRKEKNPQRIERLKFKAGLLYLRVERFNEAQNYLNEIIHSADKDMQTKARFYLGWIYKLLQQYDVSSEILSVLADDPRLDEELRTGIKAELADIYYQKGDAQTSLQHYRSITGEGCQEVQSRDAADKAWVGLAELEQSYLYYNLGDGVRAGEKIGCLVNSFRGETSFKELQSGVTQTAAVPPGKEEPFMAFANLQKGRIEQARELFDKGQKADPDNYLNYSGLAMVKVFSANLGEAEKEARQGYKMHKTEYSAAVLGYVLAFQNQTDQAIAYYLQSVELQPNYIPARFNLACLYLKTRQYREALKHLLELERQMGGRESLLLSKVLNNLGCALWWLGKESDAILRLERALQITPGYVDAELNLKQIRLERVPQPATVPQMLNIEG